MPASLSPSMDLGRPHAQGISDLEDVRQAGVPLAPLDPAHVRPIHSCVEAPRRMTKLVGYTLKNGVCLT